jgi:hypothetical protein
VAPAQFRHNFLEKYGGELAHPHLLVKYAVRYKGAGESVAVRAHALAGDNAAEVLESEPLVLDESAVTSDAPAGLRYDDLPAWFATGGARVIEKVLKERLPDKLATSLLVDPVTKALSQPGEDAEAFAARLSAAGGGARAETLRDRLEKKKRDLAAREQDFSGRKAEKWASIGTAILSNVGILLGRKRTISGAGSVLSKNRMENTAEAKVEALRAEIAALESELASLGVVDPGRFETREVVPAKGDLTILRYDLLWVY